MFKNNFFLIFVNKKTDLVRQNVLKFLYEYCYNITVDPKLNELCIQGSTLVPNTADRGSDVGQMFPKLMTMGGGVALRSLHIVYTLWCSPFRILNLSTILISWHSVHSTFCELNTFFL